MNKRLLIVLSTITVLVGVLTLSVFAAETTVYVKDGGTGNGSSASSPVGSIADAVTALGGKGGNIVLCGNTTVSSKTTIPEQSGNLKITASGSAKLLLTSRLQLAKNTNANVVTLDVPVDIAANYACYIFGGYNSIVFTSKFVVTKSGGSSAGLCFFGGVHQGEATGDAACVTELPYSIEVNNGSFTRFGGGGVRTNIGDHIGSIAAPVTITIKGGTFGVAGGSYPTDSNNKNYNTFSVSGMTTLADDATLTITGGTFHMPIYIQGRTSTIMDDAAVAATKVPSNRKYYAIDGDIKINISGGTFNGGAVSAYYTQAAYTQLMRGNYDVNVSGGTFAVNTLFDATQVKAYDGKSEKATLTYSGVSNINPKRFDVVNGVAKTYEEPLRVVFIGDSITEGYCIEGVVRLTDSYPAQFLKLCEEAGKEVVISNFGLSGSGLTPKSSKFYCKLLPWYLASEESDPDIVYVALGTNDAQYVGGTNGALQAFEYYYRYLISTMAALPNTDEVYITNAIFRKTSNEYVDQRASAVMRPTQEKIAKEFMAESAKFKFVDLYGLTLDMALSDELFTNDNGVVKERLHPARAGLAFMGECAYNAIFNGVTAPASYRKTVLYVSDSGSAYGAGTASDPIGTIGHAFDLMERNVPVTLHVVGTITTPSALNLAMAPSKLTVVGDGTGATVVCGNTLKMHTDTKIDNVTLKASSACYMIGGFNNIEITSSVKTSGSWAFYAGHNAYSDVDPKTSVTFDTVESVSSDRNLTVTVNGGTYSSLAFGNRRYAKDAPFGDYSGKMTATVGANVTAASSTTIYSGVAGQNYVSGTINAKINGWRSSVVNEFPTVHHKDGVGTEYDAGKNTGTINITLGSGRTNTVVYAGDFDANGSVDVKDLISAIKYMIDGFDTSKSGYYYGDSLDSLLEVLIIAKKAVK